MKPRPKSRPITTLSKASAAKVKKVLKMVAESNQRMNSYTEAQRAELEKEARKVIKLSGTKRIIPTGRPVDASPNSQEDDLLKEAKREIEKLRAALKPFAVYAERRMAQPFRGLDDIIHAIHTGTEWEAEIRFSDCVQAAKVLHS